MFDRFTEQARSAMSLARESALRLQHPYIAPEHMLLALTDESTGRAPKLLETFDVDLASLRSSIEAQLESGETPVSAKMMPFTDGAKRVLENTIDEVRRLNGHAIGSEHVLLGLLREPGGVVAAVLADEGVELQAARLRVSAPPKG